VLYTRDPVAHRNDTLCCVSPPLAHGLLPPCSQRVPQRCRSVPTYQRDGPRGSRCIPRSNCTRREHLGACRSDCDEIRGVRDLSRDIRGRSRGIVGPRLHVFARRSYVANTSAKPANRSAKSAGRAAKSWDMPRGPRIAHRSSRVCPTTRRLHTTPSFAWPLTARRELSHCVSCPGNGARDSAGCAARAATAWARPGNADRAHAGSAFFPADHDRFPQSADCLSGQ
jgi:hypothetical protein